jgi:hypothetical protein
VSKEALARKQAPVALVGKGVTFDAGGISIKPSAKMSEVSQVIFFFYFFFLCFLRVEIDLRYSTNARETCETRDRKMKGDMSGAASVIASIYGLVNLNADVSVVRNKKIIHFRCTLELDNGL